nr:uncharacterized protein LOC105347816 [Crassostrea gigas]
MAKSTFSAFLSLIRTHVKVFRNTELQAIIQIPEKVQSFSITQGNSSKSEEWILLVGSSTGKIYRTNDLEYRTQLKQAHLEYQTSLENQQIFTDLLDPQASDIKDIDNTKGPVIVSPESFVHILSSAHVLLSLKSPILDLCQTLGFIFAVIKDDDSVKVESFSSDISSKLASPLTFHVLQKRSCIQNTQNVFHLYILTCDLIQSPNQERSGTTIDLSNELFKSIGGEEVTLCNSPLLLLTSDEGSVYFSALSPHLSSHEQCNFSLLYPTSKPIKNVQSSRIALREKTNPGPDSALDWKVINGLVICSSNGDSAVLTCDKKYGAQYVPFTVPCSINDVKIVGTKMYISSGEDLLVADFTLLEKDDKYYVEMDKMTSLKFAGALKIHCVLDTSLVEETVSHILCGTESGRVSEIDVGLRLKQPATQRTQEQGRHIKELLTAIENCQLQIQRLTCKEDRQKEFISQLNVASYLMNSERLFQCEYSVLQKVKEGGFFLALKATNQSGVKLSCDWSLLVNVHQTYKHKTSSGSEKMNMGLNPNECVHIQVDLPSQDVKVHYKVTVALCLHYPVDLVDLPVPSKDSFLSILIDQKTTDILHFLFDEKCLHRKTFQTGFNLHAAITEAALRRPVSSPLSDTVPPNREDTPYHMNLFRSATLLQKTEISVHGQDMDAVLRFLTQPCQQPVNIENHEAKLVDPTGEPVKISIQVFDTDTGISMLKLTIISREISLAAAVREAISRYLQITDKALVDEHIPKEYLLKGTLPSSDLSSALISSVTKGDVVNVYRRLRCGHAE